jgi:hypothetical protein
MTSKILLGVIAAGLWANAFAGFIKPAAAASETYLAEIAHDIHAIFLGVCDNPKLCPNKECNKE